MRREVRVGFLVVVSGLMSAALWAQEAAPADPVAELRQELEALRREYAERLAALEARIAELGAVPAGPPGPEPVPPAPPSPAAPPVAAPPAVGPPPPQEATVPAGAAGAGGPTGPLPVYGAATSASKIFNPDIAVIGNFLGAAGENDVDPPSSLTLDEAEASFQAIVDPYARADFFLAFDPEGVEIEEGFVTFPTLPLGLLMKAGQIKAAFGKVNTFHAHQLPWTDRPLILANLLGGEEGVADAGVSLSRLVPNPLFFLEATGEVYQGNSALFAAPRRQDLTYAGRLRGYGDLSESANLDLGGSILYGHNGLADDTTTRLLGVDATFRWRPLRRAIYRRFLARTELVWSRTETPEARPEAFGAYVSADYQFARRWFVGARYDYAERALEPDVADEGGSFVLTFWPSEFSQVRGQYRRIRYGDGPTADELLFQLLFSIGAHGAHTF